MKNGFSVKEVAAIADVPESVIRTAIERDSIRPKANTVGRSIRYSLDSAELFFVKLLSEFPFDLGRDDKEALCKLAARGTGSEGRWRRRGSDFVLQSGDVVIHVEVKTLRNKVERNLAIYEGGRKRVISDPEILGGEPVFKGTRVPVSHVVQLIAKGVPIDEIKEDYPALTSRDLAFAEICARMKPGPGRPRKPLDLRRHVTRRAERKRASSR